MLIKEWERSIHPFTTKGSMAGSTIILSLLIIDVSLIHVSHTHAYTASLCTYETVIACYMVTADLL